MGVPDAHAGDVRDQIAGHRSLERLRVEPITGHHVPASAAIPACLVRARTACTRVMAADVSIAAALIAGLLSFLSPCVLPLVPPYLVYLAGASLERLADDEPERRVRRDAVLAALLFVCGFSTVFIAFGASASLLGQLVLAWSPQLATVAGIVIIIMGLHFLGLTRIGVLMREKRAPIAQPVRVWGAYVMGLAFAFGWTPCIGPILAAILAVAASKDTVTRGAGLLAVYSAGLGIPFLLCAFFVEPAMAALARFRRHLDVVEKVMGVLLVLTGIAFLTGFVAEAAFWLLEWFPALGKIG
jgi:cytochrome c-type biogenesis protein